MVSAAPFTASCLFPWAAPPLESNIFAASAIARPTSLVWKLPLSVGVPTLESLLDVKFFSTCGVSSR